MSDLNQSVSDIISRLRGMEVQVDDVTVAEDADVAPDLEASAHDEDDDNCSLDAELWKVSEADSVRFVIEALEIEPPAPQHAHEAVVLTQDLVAGVDLEASEVDLEEFEEGLDTRDGDRGDLDMGQAPVALAELGTSGGDVDSWQVEWDVTVDPSAWSALDEQRFLAWLGASEKMVADHKDASGWEEAAGFMCRLRHRLSLLKSRGGAHTRSRGSVSQGPDLATTSEFAELVRKTPLVVSG